jgi:outer membrane cobalamin receptor
MLTLAFAIVSPNLVQAYDMVGAVDSGDTVESPEPPAEDESVFPMPAIAVTARKVYAPPTIIVRKASSEDISAWNSHNVGDALTYVPGVNVQIGGTSGDARAWIRGFRDRDVLVLFDGIPIASGFEGTIDLNEIAVENISAIKVLKSAPSVIYGTNGVGGVIDVIPQTGQVGNFLDGGVELGGDNRRLLRANGGGGNGNISFSLSAQHHQADDFSLSDDYTPDLNQPEGRRVNSDFERSSLLLQFDALQTPLGHSSMFINISDAEKGLPVETGVDDPDFERLTKSIRKTLGISNHFNNIPLSVKLYYNGYDSDLTVYTDESFSEVDEIEKAEDYSYGGKMYSTLDTSLRNSIILAASAQTDVFKAEGELENGNKAELSTYTLAIEDQFWMKKQLSLVVGGIYNYFDQTRLGKTSSSFDPQLAVAWQATPVLALHASAAQRTRFPKLRELYRRKWGNPDLDPQTARNYEIGITYQHRSGISTDFSIYRSDVDDLIERPHRRSIYLNLDQVKFKGIELASGGWITERVFARVAYTYVDAAEDLSEGGSRQLRSRPENTVIAEFRYRFAHEILFSFNGIYVSGLFDLDPDGVYTEIPGYFVANAKVSKPFAQHYEVYLSVTNMGDTDYVQRLGNPREGRAFLLGLNLNY